MFWLPLSVVLRGIPRPVAVDEVHLQQVSKRACGNFAYAPMFIPLLKGNKKPG